MTNQKNLPKHIIDEIRASEEIMTAAIASQKSVEDFNKAHNITYEDIQEEIKKLPKTVQDEIIHAANEISKSIFEDENSHGQKQKHTLNRKLTRYKNKI